MSTTTQANAVNWFEIPVNDMKRAKAFYDYVLGVDLQLNQMGPLEMAWFPMNEGAPGATGSLVKGDSYRPSYSGTMVYLSVESIDETLKKVNERGGKTILGKTSIGEHGYIAHFEDSEGNRVSLHCF